MDKPSKSKIILVIIGGASLELTHPVIMFLSVLIASGMGLISSITKKTRWQDLVVLFFIVASLMAPFGAIRLFEKGVVDKISYNVETASASYEIEKYTNIVNDVFYGLNPEVLMFFDIPPATPFYDEFQYFRLLPGLIAALAGILALAKLTDGPLHWYVFTSVFVVLLATLPYTGWLLGYFISARLISRASWFLPLGMGGIVILKSLLARINQNKKARLFKPLSYVLIIFCCLFVSPRIMFTILPRIPSYFLLLEKNKQLAQIGAYIDQNTSGQVMAIALDSWDTQLLPDVSAHTRLISFREEKDYNPHNYFLSLDEIHERIDASNSIQSLDQTVSADKRCAYIENYNVQFVLAQSDTVERFEKLISKCNRNNQIVFKTGDLVLLELK